uniref:Uncharacterized protein n=1 Tax=Brassica oleracea var. oleracea TaxID=109376 RepID=A0A0D3AND0_BRAOL
MVRKNENTSHYREMFSEHGSRTCASSSSAPSSSIPETVPDSQSSQRVSQSPPFGAPPVPPYVAPSVPRFGVDRSVARNVMEVIKGYFPDAHPNWKLTPDHVRKTWYKMLAQKYHWSIGVNERVKKAFVGKVKARLLDTVSNWKDDWIVKGYEQGKTR